jgi:monothiol glutaredoxin
MTTIERIKSAIADNNIVIFMKGTPDFPQCGFSAQTVKALRACGAEFAHVDVLANPDIRAELPGYAQWPTFPQVYIKGELIGGCDIVMELYQSGELQTMVDAVKAG